MDNRSSNTILELVVEFHASRWDRNTFGRLPSCGDVHNSGQTIYEVGTIIVYVGMCRMFEVCLEQNGSDGQFEQQPRR